MNAETARALYEAQEKGVRQLRYVLKDGHGGYCALGLLPIRLLVVLLGTPVEICPLCGDGVQQEASLVMHLNNEHEMSFAEIARKLGPDSV